MPGILMAVGMAAFAPQLLRIAARIVSPILGRTGVAGHLAGLTTYRRSHILGTVVGAGTVFAATATGIIMLVGIDARTFVLPAGMEQEEADTIALLNNVVVGMIGVFCALVLVNALLAVVGDRRVEFARLRLVGATQEQVRNAVLVEAVLVSLIAGVLGTSRRWPPSCPSRSPATKDWCRTVSCGCRPSSPWSPWPSPSVPPASP